MLQDTLVNMCGEQFAETIPASLPPRGHYMSNGSHPMTSAHLQPIVEHLAL